MKSMMLLVSLYAFHAVAAPAPVLPPQPLLMHAYDEGLVPQYLYHRSTCQIFSDKVVVTRLYAGVETSETHALAFPAGALAKLQGLVDKASQGAMESKDAPTDIPYDGYTALVHPQAPTLILRASQSSKITENKALEAKSLIKLIDAHCPELKR